MSGDIDYYRNNEQIKETLENTDNVQVENNGFEQEVQASYFLSRLIETASVQLVEGVRVFRFTFADSHTVDIPI